MVRTLLPLALAATLTTALPLTARAPTCVSGLYILVARGSTEAPGEGKPGQVASLITARVPDSTSVAIDYPATIFSDGAYPDSVTDGINDTQAKIQAYVDACGDAARIVLLGYSQGGNVMTDTLAGGVDKPAPIPASLQRYITGVAVFGDPTFTAAQSFDRGTATKDGIFAREEGGASLALLNTYAGVLRSYCDKHDPFCASGDELSVHTSEVPNHAQDAADFIVGLVQ